MTKAVLNATLRKIDKLKHDADVMLAFSEGRGVKFRQFHTMDWTVVHPGDAIEWNFDINEYELLEYREFNPDELLTLIGRHVVFNPDKSVHTIDAVHTDWVHVSNVGEMDAIELFSQYKFLDGRVCGMWSV